MEIKTRIIQEARLLFMEQGVKAVTMDDIASHLGMSKRTIYEIFTDKTELLREILVHHSEEKGKYTIEQVEGNNVVEALHYLLKHIDKIAHNYKDFKFIQGIKKYYPELHKEIVEKGEKMALEKFELFIERGKKEGVFLEATNPKISSIIIREQMKQMSQFDNFSMAVKRVELFKYIMVTFFRGIATGEGVKDIDDMLQEYKKEESTENIEEINS